MSHYSPKVRIQPNRLLVMILAMILAVVFIAVLSLLIGDTKAGVMLLDSQSTIFYYPFTIQNLMYVLFFIGLGEVFVRWVTALKEKGFLKREYLPEDDETVLQAHDLGPIRRELAGTFNQEHGFLPSLIDLSILQFLSSRSTDQTVSVLNSSLELINHRVELRYSTLRYLVWVIPTIGFIGTVVGISQALGQAAVTEDLKVLTDLLAVAFNTTLVALGLSAVLVFFLHLVQRQEEHSVNMAGNYTLVNLINRLYTGGES